MADPAPTNQDFYNYCALPLAGYACRPDKSRGRIYEEHESKYRTCFQRDRDRVIHSAAFRRLKYKTQVFVYHQGDHYRTRLTHTLEVAQITRTLARALMVNEDLAEAVALAHDLGHPPFGHIAENRMDERMAGYGGFDHNDQSLRLLTMLERKYPAFHGLNLTWETLEGAIKHNGPLTGRRATKKDTKILEATKQTARNIDLDLSTYAAAEAQIAALADDIAYNNHDVEDGLQAGLFTLEDVREVPLLDELVSGIESAWPELDEDILIHETIREMIGSMVEDVLHESQRRLADLAPQSPEDVRNADIPVIAFSDSMRTKAGELRSFLMERMYRHYKVMRTMSRVTRLVEDLFTAFMENERLLPDKWQQRIREESSGADAGKARIIADYIASMTDRYAITEHQKLFAPYQDLYN